MNEPIEGAYYATKMGDVAPGGVFRVIQVLRVTPEGVHVRLFEDSFSEVPSNLRTENLVDFVGHMPLTVEEFYRWDVVFVQTGIVTDGDLEGYRLWIEEQGGHFG